MPNQKRILCVSIDTECDKSIDWRVSNPMGFSSITHGIPEILQPRFRKYGVKSTYLISNEVLEDPRCLEVFQSISSECELGTHLHADFIEPQKRFVNFSGQLCDDFQIDYPPEIEFEKLQRLTELFKKSLGFSPRVFRAGRFAANHHTIASLEKLGYLVDSSVTPHSIWKNREGKQLDFSTAPEQPYFPDRRDITRKGSSKTLEIPVTIWKRLDVWLYQQYYWLRPSFSSGKRMIRTVKHYLRKFAQNRILVLVMMFHSMEVIPGASPYNRDPATLLRFLDSMDEVFAFCREANFEFKGFEDSYNDILSSGTL